MPSLCAFQPRNATSFGMSDGIEDGEEVEVITKLVSVAVVPLLLQPIYSGASSGESSQTCSTIHEAK